MQPPRPSGPQRSALRASTARFGLDEVLGAAGGAFGHGAADGAAAARDADGDGPAPADGEDGRARAVRTVAERRAEHARRARRAAARRRERAAAAAAAALLADAERTMRAPSVDARRGRARRGRQLEKVDGRPPRRSR